MTAQPYSFDLVEEPWLTVQALDGTFEVVGLRDALGRAHQLRALLADHAGQYVALLRLLVAITARADRRPLWQAWAHRASPSGPFPRVTGYLRAHQAGFDLFNEHTPFLQAPTLQYVKPRPPSTTPLAPAWMSADPPSQVTPATAARGLVWLQTYATAGITSPTIGDDRAVGGKIMPIGPGWGLRATLLLLEGQTLAETILLNTPQLDSDTTTSPAPWEPSGPPTSSSPETGLDLLTWPCRMVRLIPDETRMVHDVVITAGARIELDQVVGLDPMTAWVQTGIATPKPWRRTPMAANAWTMLPALLDPPPTGPNANGRRLVHPPAVLDLARRFADLDPSHHVTVRTVTAVTDDYRSVIRDLVDDTLTVNISSDGMFDPDLPPRLRALYQCAKVLAQHQLHLRAATGSTETSIRDADLEHALTLASRHAPDAALDQPGWRERATQDFERTVIHDVDQAPFQVDRATSPRLEGWAGPIIDGHQATRLAQARIRKALTCQASTPSPTSPGSPIVHPC